MTDQPQPDRGSHFEDARDAERDEPRIDTAALRAEVDDGVDAVATDPGPWPRVYRDETSEHYEAMRAVHGAYEALRTKPYVVGSEPPPVRGTADVLPMVIDDLRARSAHGVRKYGQPLRAHDGRDGLVDVYDELLDATMYARKELHERMVPPSREALDLVREALMQRRAGPLDDDGRAWCGKAQSFLATAQGEPSALTPAAPLGPEAEIRSLREELEVSHALRASAGRKHARSDRLQCEMRNEIAVLRQTLDALRAGDTLAQLVDEIQGWQRQTFASPTVKGAMSHLRKESHELERMSELLAIVATPDEAVATLEAARVECIDLFFLATQAAAVLGMDAARIADVLRAKLRENRARVWGKPDADGVVEHVRGGR